jgi:hypothetical protein
MAISEASATLPTAQKDSEVSPTSPVSLLIDYTLFLRRISRLLVYQPASLPSVNILKFFTL